MKDKPSLLDIENINPKDIEIESNFDFWNNAWRVKVKLKESEEE